MTRLLVAAALIAACRGDGKPKQMKDDAAPSGAASSVSAPAEVPKLPSSPEGEAELKAIGQDIERMRGDKLQRPALVNLLLVRASITGALEDYVEMVAISKAWIADSPKDAGAWKARVQALARVHRFADARAALEKLKPLVPVSGWNDLAATLDEATGSPEKATPVREELAKVLPRPEMITQLAGNLALRGRIADAIALIPKAIAGVHDNSPVLFAWLYFQWGRLYEQKGELARARDHYAEARRRLPGHVEATAHLAATMTATGQDPSGILAEALAENRHPELLALAGKTEEAKQAWERYVVALPEAFSDHAARFYLAGGKDPVRALALAQVNVKNRDTTEARSLVIEAALAANAPAEACSVVDPVIASPQRAQQFIAWRALTACGRKADADKLAATLGIR
ncbi:MAG: tetratricopeptide repeat protein [Deltaproteobacteria bacterium]|nr:tetratricopeptide repeat protein [Deltaproteobacteria bacterium]